MDIGAPVVSKAILNFLTCITDKYTNQCKVWGNSTLVLEVISHTNFDKLKRIIN